MTGIFTVLVERVRSSFSFHSQIPQFRAQKGAESHIRENQLFFISFFLFPGSSLTCHTCYSQKSWADCRRNSTARNCESFLDTCMVVHRKKTLHGGKIVHEFAKSCFVATLCKKSFCEHRTPNETDVTCDVLNCCSTSLCNTGYGTYLVTVSEFFLSPVSSECWRRKTGVAR